MWKPALVGLSILVACGHDGSARPPETSTASTTPPASSTNRTSNAVDRPPAYATAGDAAAARATWVRTVNAYVANPKTIPRLSNPDGKKQFEALLAERAWIDIDGATFEREAPELLAFFPVAKALSIELVKLGATDESVLLKLYMDDTNRALIGAGIEFMEAQRRIEPDQSGREAGLQRMQIGLAMEVCAMLFESSSASPAISRRVLERFSAPATYALHSAEGLQLILATIDGRLDRRRNAAVRATVEKVHAERVAASGRPARVFEALTIWSPMEARTVESDGGNFAVTVGHGALVWRSDSPRPATEHLEWRDGELLFEVYCMTGLAVDGVVTSMAANGMKERQGPGPGHWLTTLPGTDRDGAMRVVEISGRVCLAGIEAPRGSVPPARLDEILGSLRPSR